MLKHVLMNAAREAAAIMKEYAVKTFAISNKEGINNLVTEVDHKCEEIIFGIIKKNYPDHDILSEESGEIIQGSSYKWIIDPIDGTVNFAKRIPVCCVSIGVEVNGKMEMGVVYNPFINELFFAQRGYGATLNDQLIHVSKTTDLAKSCIATGFPYTYLDMPNGPLEVFSKFIRKGVPVRRLGSAAIDMCYVAAGRFDGFYEHKLNAWDSAAGFLIIEEAGGKVTDLKGEPYNIYKPGVIASNGIIHDDLLAVVKGGEV
ncbi:MAG TPA: inositol monophosphatase family protein [Parafilimonas sp.]|nr:inositol monophosphatase family protein [Parafilimonas sp.]